MLVTLVALNLVVYDPDVQRKIERERQYSSPSYNAAVVDALKKILKSKKKKR